VPAGTADPLAQADQDLLLKRRNDQPIRRSAADRDGHVADVVNLRRKYRKLLRNPRAKFLLVPRNRRRIRKFPQIDQHIAANMRVRRRLRPRPQRTSQHYKCRNGNTHCERSSPHSILSFST